MSSSDENWFSGFTIENVDWRDTSPLSRAFVDTLCLALIRAHPMQSEQEINDYQRLRDAKESLFGIKPHDDLKAYRDLPALELMAKGYISDRGGGTLDAVSGEIEWGDHDPKAIRGDAVLARDAIAEASVLGIEIDTLATPKSVEVRLAKKFKNDRDVLLPQVLIHGSMETDFIRDWITQAKALFEPFTIPISEPDDPMKDLKYPF